MKYQEKYIVGSECIARVTASCHIKSLRSSEILNSSNGILHNPRIEGSLNKPFVFNDPPFSSLALSLPMIGYHFIFKKFNKQVQEGFNVNFVFRIVRRRPFDFDTYLPP